MKIINLSKIRNWTIIKKLKIPIFPKFFFFKNIKI